MKSTLALLVIFTLPALAFANSKWLGHGEQFTPDGQSLGTYSVEVDLTETAPNTTQSTTTLKFQDGSEKIIRETVISQGRSWNVVSDLGKGQGVCYGQDLCENYTQDDKGQAVATTIVRDSDSHRRDLSVVLENGKAVKVFKDDISKL